MKPARHQSVLASEEKQGTCAYTCNVAVPARIGRSRYTGERNDRSFRRGAASAVSPSWIQRCRQGIRRRVIWAALSQGGVVVLPIGRRSGSRRRSGTGGPGQGLGAPGALRGQRKVFYLALLDRPQSLFQQTKIKRLAGRTGDRAGNSGGVCRSGSESGACGRDFRTSGAGAPVDGERVDRGRASGDDAAFCRGHAFRGDLEAAAAGQCEWSQSVCGQRETEIEELASALDGTYAWSERT